MMQKKVAGQEPEISSAAAKEGRSAEEIREIIRTIESYLARTRESIERIEKFIAELRKETRVADEKEKIREKEPGNKRDSDQRYSSPFI